MPLKVAYFTNQYPKVSHTFIRREILALERAGFEVMRIAVRGWDEKVVDDADLSEQRRTQYLLQNGLPAVFAASVRVLLQSPGKFLLGLQLALRIAKGSDKSVAYHLVYLAEACLLRLLLESSSISHLHVHFGTNPTEVAMLARVLGGPKYSFTAHGPDEFDRPQALGMGEKIRHSEFSVAISSYGKSQLYRWAEYTQWQKIHVVHCGLDEDFLEYDCPPVQDVRRFVCVGRLCEQKGQLLLIEAMHLLKTEGIYAELTLAGDGEMRQQIEALIIRYGMSDRISITGWIDSSRVQSEIIASRALVLPSFAEGLPVVIMEAMALGRPVLSTYVAGIPELVIHGTNGWLFPAGSIDELASAIKDCLAKTEVELQSMGAAGHKRVAVRHSIAKETEKLAMLFKRSVQQH